VRIAAIIVATTTASNYGSSRSKSHLRCSVIELERLDRSRLRSVLRLRGSKPEWNENADGSPDKRTFRGRLHSVGWPGLRTRVATLPAQSGPVRSGCNVMVMPIMAVRIMAAW
jgi:hypothetical protein